MLKIKFYFVLFVLLSCCGENSSDDMSLPQTPEISTQQEASLDTTTSTTSTTSTVPECIPQDNSVINFENVSNMQNFVIKSQSKKGYSKILDCIARYLGTGYTIYTFDQEFADYGVPHFRKRLITIAKRTGKPSRLTKSKPEWFSS